MDIQNLQSVSEFRAGVPWLAERPGRLRHLLNTRAENGLAEAGAVVRLGRKLMIDPERFAQWVDRQRESAAGAA